MSTKDSRLASKPIAPIGVNRTGQPIKVVVVDDVFMDLRIMSQMLRSAGFDVVGEAKDGEEGIRMVSNEKPQLVILDYMMPKMNGLEALKEIKKRVPKAFVVMSTSETEKEIARELIIAGAGDYIVKPFDRNLIMKKFKAAVQAILENGGA